MCSRKKFRSKDEAIGVHYDKARSGKNYFFEVVMSIKSETLL